MASVPLLTPYGYAEHLASYVSCPSTIRAHCVREFGRDRAPPLTAIERMRQKAQKERDRFKAHSESSVRGPVTDDHYRVPSLVPVEKPRKQPWPSWYQPPGVHKRGTALLSSIAHDFGLTVEEMRGRRSDKLLVDARAVAVKVLRERGLSFPQIGKLIGRDDHTTVMHSFRQFGIYANRNPKVASSYNRHRDRAE